MAKYKATIQYPKTPKLQILKKRDTGELVITYADEDPLGLRSSTTANLDKEVQRLFGYSSWNEYKEKNIFDLKKEVKRDETGRITQAPTVHPFHVSYALEEFFDNFDASSYEVVGVPANMENSTLKWHKTINDIISLRKSYFGDSASGRYGIINIAMREPEEGLQNKKIITRIKQKWGNLEDVFASRFQGNFVVMHPSGKPWSQAAQAYNDVASSSEDALTIDVKTALENSVMLKEGILGDIADWITGDVYEWTKEWVPFVQDLDDMYHDYKPAWDGLILAIQTFDPSGVTSWPEFYMAVSRLEDNPTGGKEWANLGFALLSVIPVAKYAAKAAKFEKAVDSIQDVAKMMRSAPGNVENNRRVSKEILRLSREAKKLDLSDTAAMRKYSDELADLADKALLHPASKAIIKNSSKKLRKTAGTWAQRYGGKQGRQYLSHIGDIGQYFTEPGEDGDDTGDGGGGSYDGGYGGGQGLPDMPVSPDGMTFYILPKNWRKFGLNWLTREEIILSQRIGANNNVLVNPERRTNEQDMPDSLAGSHFLVFGHSQASHNMFGGMVEKLASPVGAKITRNANTVFGGHSDDQLTDKLTKIPPQRYTHAFLFLGGNTAGRVSRKTLMEDSKTKIINHMVKELNVPKNNILVILPPVNTDNDYSRSRINLNKEAEKIFQNMGIKVHPQVSGTKKDFYKDGFHIKGNSNLAEASVGDMFGSFVTERGRTSDVTSGIPVPYDFIKNQLEIDKDTWDIYRREVAKIESGGKYSLKGGANKHYDGRYQIGASAKKGGAKHFGIGDPGHGRSERESFRADPALQEKIFAGLTVGNHKSLMRNSKKYKGKSRLEQLKILGYAHNQGAGGAAKWLRTGRVGRDAFGTAGTKYYDALGTALANRTLRKPSTSRRYSSGITRNLESSIFREVSIWGNGNLKESNPQSWKHLGRYWDTVGNLPGGSSDLRKAAKFASSGLLTSLYRGWNQRKHNSLGQQRYYSTNRLATTRGCQRLCICLCILYVST